MNLKLLCFGLVALAGSVALPLHGETGAYSRAVNVTPLLKTQTDGAGRALVYPTHAPAEITALLVEIAPGQQTNWHKHPIPCVAYLLEGELHVELPDGTEKVLRAGEAFAEVVELLHNGHNRGTVPAKLVLFALGAAGEPYVVKGNAPAAAQN